MILNFEQIQKAKCFQLIYLEQQKNLFKFLHKVVQLYPNFIILIAYRQSSMQFHLLELMFQFRTPELYINLKKGRKNSEENMKDDGIQLQNQQTEKSWDNEQELKSNKDFDIFTNTLRINLYTFPSSQTNFVRILIIFIFRYLLIGSNTFTFLGISAKQLNCNQSSIVMFDFFDDIKIYSQLFLAILTGWIMGTLIYMKIYENDPKVCDSVFIIILEYAVQLNLHLNGFLLLFSLQENIALYVISVILSFYSVINLQNYIIKLDYMYHSSVNSNIAYYAITMLAYLCNSVSLFLQHQIFFIFSISLYCILYVCWYLISGSTLYIYLINKTCLLILISFEIFCCFMVVQSYILGNYELQISSITKLIFIVVCSFMSLKTLIYRKFQILITKIKDMGEQDLIAIELAAKILKNSLDMVEYEPMIIGIIRCFQMEGFSPEKMMHNSTVYDSVSRSYISTNKLWVQCDIFFKHFVRQQYQSIQKGHQHIQFQLKYCEFMINQQPNQSIITHKIQTLRLKSLNFLQKIQLQKMKKIIELKVSRLNTNIYEGSLELQNLIISEHLFSRIEQNLKEYLFKNISLWSIFSESQLNMSSIKKLFIQSFKLVKDMDRSWKYLSKYFCIHKRWRYLFVNYNLYIKNRKISAKQAEEFKGSESLEAIFKQQRIYFDKIATQQIVQNKYFLFDSQTSVFHACLEHDQLFIKRISQYFTKNFQYEASEIIGANLNIILPSGLKEKHMDKFFNWVHEGHQINQQSYQIKLSECLDRQGNRIPVLKCFKTFVNFFMHQMEYVCLLKINRKRNAMDHQRFKRFAIFEQQREKSINESKIIDILDLQKESIANLSHENNIFIKDESFLPVEELKELKDIKMLVRFYAFVVTLIIIILAILNNNNSNELVSYSSEYINFMQTYRLPMIIANSFYKQILNIGNQTQIKSQIANSAELLRSISTNKLTIKTLFDETINKPALYYPKKSSSINQNASYNQIELFYLISSTITSLANAQSVDIFSRDFQLLTDNLKPGYDTFLNRTKLQFHHIFERDINNIYSSILDTVYIQIAVLVIFLLVSFDKVITFFRRIKSIVINIAEFKQADMNIIYHYWCKTFLIFEKIIFKNHCIENSEIKTYRHLRRKEFGMKKLQQLQNIHQQNINLNRQQKNIHFNKEGYRFKIKIFMLILLTMLCSFVIVTIIEIDFINKFSEIGEFENDGFAFLQYYPAATIVGVGCFQKTFAHYYPNLTNFRPHIYDDVLSDLWLVGNFKYISQVHDPNSLYYTKQRAYFFENPCQFNPEVAMNIGISQIQCETIAQASFTRGLTAFMRLAYGEAFSCIKENNLMSEDKLDEFSHSVSLLSAYILDAITTWGVQFNNRINALISSFFQSNVLEVILIIGVHLLVFQLFVLRQLKKQYQFYRLLYLSMVPHYILIKDKIVRQKFLSNKIIQFN